MRLLYAFTFFCTGSFLFAQADFEYVFPGRYALANAAASRGGLIAVGGKVASCSIPVIYFFGPSGEKRWEVVPYNCGYCAIDDIGWENAGTILAAGTVRAADDVLGPDDGIAIARLDTAGNLLAVRQLPSHQGSFDPVSVLPLQDGGVLASHRNSFYGFDAQLQLQFSQELQQLDYFEHVIDLAWVVDNSLAVLTTDRIFLADASLSFTDTLLPPSGELLAMAAGQEGLFVASSEVLRHYSPAGAEDYLLPTGLQVEGLLQEAGNLLAWGVQPAGGRAVVYRFSAGNWQEALRFGNTYRSLGQLILTDSGYALIGAEIAETGTSGEPYTLAYLKHLAALEGDAASGYDLSIAGMEVLDAELAFVIEGPNEFNVEHRIYLEVEVVNHGGQPVSDLLLGSEQEWSFNCGEGRYLRNFSGLFLQPGESAFLQAVTTHFAAYSSPNPPVVELSRCFFAATPNRQLDDDPSNNTFCRRLTVQEEISRLEWQIFPNPASSLLYVEAPAGFQPGSYEWLNAAGQLTGQGKWTLTERLELVRPGPAGLYWLRIVNREGVICRPVIWK